MTKIYCDYCGKEVAQSKAIDVTLTINSFLICMPAICTNEISHQFCPDCWEHIRDNILNKACAPKEETK